MPAQAKEPKAPDYSADLFDDERVIDPLEQVEVVDIENDPVVNAQPAFDLPDMSVMIKQLVEAELQKQAQGRNSMIDASARNAPAVTPEVKYLKHYRCDSSPEMEVLELDMESEAPHLTPKPGAGMMKFRRGHFFAMTENQVKQIEWMRAGARGVPDAKTKFGGVSGIYEDSGEILYYCPYGCTADQFVTASKDAYHAHLRATHNVEI